MNELKRRKLPYNEVGNTYFRIIATSEITAIFEIVRHSFKKEEAYNYIEFIERSYYPGKKEILGF